MDGEKLPQVDLSVAVLVELLERLRDEDRRAPLGADLREDEVLELVLRQNLQSYSRYREIKIRHWFRETISRNLVPVTVGVRPPPAIPLPPLVLVSVVQSAWVDDGLQKA